MIDLLADFGTSPAYAEDGRLGSRVGSPMMFSILMVLTLACRHLRGITRYPNKHHKLLLIVIKVVRYVYLDYSVPIFMVNPVSTLYFMRSRPIRAV